MAFGVKENQGNTHLEVKAGLTWLAFHYVRKLLESFVTSILESVTMSVFFCSRKNKTKTQVLEAESEPVGFWVVWPLGSWWAWVILPLTLGGGVGLHSARSTGELAPQETLGMEQKNGYGFKVNVRTASRPRRDRKGQNDQRTILMNTLLWGAI